jgi:hypothetical protein
VSSPRLITAAVSQQLIPILVDRGLPPLTDGKILFGPQHLAEMSAAPRVVFVHVGGKFGPSQPSSSPNNTRQVVAGDPLNLNDGQRNRLLARPIGNDEMLFEVHCWGDVPSQEADPDLAFDYAVALVHSVQLACNQAFGPQTDSSWMASNYKSKSAADGNAKLNTAGESYVFQLMVNAPVLDVAEVFVTGPITQTLTSVTLSNEAS